MGHPSDPSTWTQPIGSTDYAPLSGTGYDAADPADYPPAAPLGPPGTEPPRRRHAADPGAPTGSPEPAQPTESMGAAEPAPSGGGAFRHLLGGLVAVVFTPVAVALLIYGGHRYFEMAERSDFTNDARGLITLGTGAVLLLVVASLGALSPVGPFLAGVVYGLAPAAFYLVRPEDAIDWIDGTPVATAGMESVALYWLALGCFLAVGVTLVGTGVTAAFRRRR